MRRLLAAVATGVVVFAVQLGRADAANAPDISVTKSADQAMVDSGDPIGFTVTVANSGASGTGAANDVSVTDELPLGVGWNLDRASPANACSLRIELRPAGSSPPSQDVVSCSIPTLDPGASVTFHVASASAPQACGIYANTVSVTVDNETGGPFTSSATTTVLCPALSLSDTADSPSVMPGSPVGFTVILTNVGHDPAVTVHFDLTAIPGMGAPVWNTTAAWTRSCMVAVIDIGVPPQRGGVEYVCTIPELDPGAGNAVTARLTAVAPPGSCGAVYSLSAAVSLGHAGGAQAGRATTTVQCSSNSTDSGSDASGSTGASSSDVLGANTGNRSTASTVPVPATGGDAAGGATLPLALELSGMVLIAGARLRGWRSLQRPLVMTAATQRMGKRPARCSHPTALSGCGRWRGRP